MRRPKILVVEDERVVAADIEESLSKLGYTVVGAAASAVTAIRRAVETEPDLVLMDIKLRGRMDGIEAARELHDRLGIPVVFLTAYADDAILARAKRSSPSGYVLKPFDERSLRSAVEIALDRHPRERRLRESERRLATALGSLRDAVILTRGDARIAFMNRTAERLTGWRREQAIGREAGDVVVLIDRASGSLKTDPTWRVLREGAAVGLGDTLFLVSRHGVETPIKGTITPLRDEDREVVGAALVFQARGAEEEGLRIHAGGFHDRMETLGRLASGTADLFAGVSDTVRQAAAELRGRLADDAEALRILESLETRISEVRPLIEKLQALSSVGTGRPRAKSVNEITKGLEPVLPLAAGRNVSVEVRCGAEAGTALMEPVALEQVILDLVMLSSRRMPFGGRIEIETDSVELLREYARAHTSLDEGDYAVISISAAGDVVVPPPDSIEEDCPALRETIRAMGGDIVILSEPGRVTTYNIYLSALDRAA